MVTTRRYSACVYIWVHASESDRRVRETVETSDIKLLIFKKFSTTLKPNIPWRIYKLYTVILYCLLLYCYVISWWPRAGSGNYAPISRGELPAIIAATIETQTLNTNVFVLLSSESEPPKSDDDDDLYNILCAKYIYILYSAKM